MFPSCVMLNTYWLALAMLLQVIESQNTSPGCSNNCAVCAGGALYEWVSASFETTITAGTIVSIINSADDTTSTSTIHNELPSGVTLPATNAEGTHIATITKYEGDTESTVVLAFPTPSVDWGTGYEWGGTLLTTAGPDGQTSCVTVSGSLTSVTYTSAPPQPSVPAAPQDDPRGFAWTMATYYAGGDELRSAFDDAAIQSCTECSATVGGPVPALTVQFVIATSTTYKDVSTSSTSLAIEPQSSASASPPGMSGLSPSSTVPASSSTFGAANPSSGNLITTSPAAASSGGAAAGTSTTSPPPVTSTGGVANVSPCTTPPLFFCVSILGLLLSLVMGFPF